MSRVSPSDDDVHESSVDQVYIRVISCPHLNNCLFLFVSIFREFIKMGFIDKDKVAIWGWVSSFEVERAIKGSKRELMFHLADSVLDLSFGRETSSSNELFVFHSLMVDMLRRWSWDLAVGFSNAEWRWLRFLNGNITVFFSVFLSKFFLSKTFPDLVHSLYSHTLSV